VQTRIFANHQGDNAHEEILRLLDANHDGSEKDGIPVLLTVQVDSVSKGQDDKLIPANVAQAINFYQIDGLLHG